MVRPAAFGCLKKSGWGALSSGSRGSFRLCPITIRADKNRAGPLLPNLLPDVAFGCVHCPGALKERFAELRGAAVPGSAPKNASTRVITEVAIARIMPALAPIRMLTDKHAVSISRLCRSCGRQHRSVLVFS